MAVSEWFSDEELIAELESFFSIDEIQHMNFRTYLGQISIIDENIRQIRIKNRVFQFDMKFCNVTEVL